MEDDIGDNAQRVGSRDPRLAHACTPSILIRNWITDVRPVLRTVASLKWSDYAVKIWHWLPFRAPRLNDTTNSTNHPHFTRWVPNYHPLR
jgi:hypothetical protein